MIRRAIQACKAWWMRSGLGCGGVALDMTGLACTRKRSQCARCPHRNAFAPPGGLKGNYLRGDIDALRHRARLGMLTNAFSDRPRGEVQFAHWQGYARALKDLEGGVGASLANKDAALGGYEPPPYFAAALGLLGDDIDGLSRVEIAKRVADAGIEIARDRLTDGDVVTARELEHGEAGPSNVHDEHAAPGVVVGDVAGGHGGSVAASSR